MAINRALMNRQMYNMGGSSLQTGAPDITLTGDMRPTYSAMRKQRLAGGGIAGLQNRQRYFIGGVTDFLKSGYDKFVDDIIPNEIKENPVVSGLIGAGLINQFGLPGSQYIGLNENFGQNFLGNLINKDLVIGPGGEQISDLSDANIGFEIPKESTGGYFPNLSRFEVGSGYYGEPTNQSMQDYLIDYAKNVGSELIPDQLKPFIPGMNTGTNTSQLSQAGRDALILQEQKQKQLNANLMKALAAGTAAGAYVESQPKDELPADTTGIDIPAITTAARGTDADAEAAGLRFLPPQVARAANGGRIGYANGMSVDELPYAADVNPNKPPMPVEKIIEAYMKSREGTYYIQDQIDQGKSMQQIINQMRKELNIDPNFTKQIPEREIGMDPGFTRQLPERTIDIDPDFEIQLRSGGAQGGRIGYDMGGLGGMMASNIENDKILEALLEKYLDMGLSLPKAQEAAQEEFDRMSKTQQPNRVMAQEGGLMDLGGMEKDYREEGGFVPIGGKEKADDVPARLSKNEFVFTADAVRNAGGGDIDEGAQVMENVMRHLEAGGTVSPDSQGLEGAREMFQTSQRLEKRII